MNSTRHSDKCGRPATGSYAEFSHATDKLARFHRISWKKALGEIVSPAFRLHRYRSAHNRLLLDALCELDCKSGRGSKRRGSKL